MSGETLTDLWRECVASGYGWRPGMLATDGISVSYRLVYDEGGYWWAWANYPDPHTDSLCRAPLDESGCVPVFTDDSTIGCILGMVRRKHGGWAAPMCIRADGDWGVWVAVDGGWDLIGTTVYSTRRRRKTMTWSACRGATEAEALLRALLGAPNGGE